MNLGSGFFANAAAAASLDDGDAGVLGQLGLEYRSDDISITLFGRMLSNDFQPFAEEDDDGFVREDVRLNLNVPLQDWGGSTDLWTSL